MSDAIALLWPPFLVALCLIGIHAYFGIQVLTRNVIFVDLALAQIAALGATMAFMLGHPPQAVGAYVYSLAFTLLAALLLAFTRNWSRRIPQEALIGVIYVVAAAAAILLIDRAPQGAEHLKQILTGNILITGMAEIASLCRFTSSSAACTGCCVDRLAAGGRIVAVGVRVLCNFRRRGHALGGACRRVAGVFVPDRAGGNRSIVRRQLRRQLPVGWDGRHARERRRTGGLFGGDLPTGAAMVCAFGARSRWRFWSIRSGTGRSGDAPCVVRRSLRVGVWRNLACHPRLLLLAAPRADHPLVDSSNASLPSVRQVYFTKVETDTYQDAAASPSATGSRQSD